jgi:stage IV sporulation protein FB
LNRYPWQGLRVRIHPLFWLVICASVWTGYFLEIITLFILVIIHEMGHVTAAWVYGWRMDTVELLPFGGVAKIEEWGTVPAREEFIVALAGPFHHVFIVMMSFLFFLGGWWSKEWMEYFIQGNLMLACFNLLPIYPLDGGRVLQSLLSYILPYQWCINWTIGISFFLSALLAISSFLVPGAVVVLPLLLIALFLLFANGIACKQKNYQYMRFLLKRRDHGIPYGASIDVRQVREEVPLWKVIKTWYKERYHLIEVIDRQGRVIGLLSEEKMLEKYFAQYQPRCLIKELLQ